MSLLSNVQDSTGKRQIIISSNKITRNFKSMVLPNMRFYSYDRQKEMLDNLRQFIKENHPEFIFIPGNIVNDASVLENKMEMSYFIKWLDSIADISRVFIVPGRRDKRNKYPQGRIEDKAENCKLWFNRYFVGQGKSILLTNATPFKIPQFGLTISGLDSSFRWHDEEMEGQDSLARAFNRFTLSNNFYYSSNSKDEVEKIVLCSSPSGARSNMEILYNPFDLMVTGHCDPTNSMNVYNNGKNLFLNAGNINYDDLTANVFEYKCVSTPELEELQKQR